MIGWLIETLVATAILMLVVLAMRGPVRRAFGSGVTYALWLLPAIRLAMPSLPGDWHLSRWIAPLARRAQDAPGFVAGALNPATLPPEAAQHAVLATAAIGRHHGAVAFVPPVEAAAGPGLATLALIAWGIGAAAFLLYHAIAHLSFCRRLIAGATGPAIPAAGGVRIIESRAAATPLAFGIVRRYVAFPPDFAERYDAEERSLALQHELGHHARGDLIANWIALGLLALHWFDPIAWRAFRSFRADQELANDARVLAGRSAIERHTYACAIVKAAHPAFAVSATCHLNTVKDLKGRLKMLTTTRRSRRRLLLGSGAVAALTLSGLVATASGTAAAEIVRTATARDAAPIAPRSVMPAARPMAPMAPMPAMAPTPPTPPTPAMQSSDAPPPPPADMAPPAPPAPPASPVDAARIVADMPRVSSTNCGTARSGGDQMVVNRVEGGRHVIVICTDRIQRVAAEGAMTAARSKTIEHDAYAQALTGLRGARARVLADPNVTGEARSEALAAIDESIHELESDLAHLD